MLVLTKALARSTVHRDVPLDCVYVRRVCTPTAHSSDELRFARPLHRQRLQRQSAEAIPLLRQKVARVAERSGFAPTSHDGRTLANVLESYPRDELFRLGVDELCRARCGRSCAWACAGGSGSS